MFRSGLKNFLEMLGNFQTRVLLTLVYVIVAIPTSVVVKMFYDPLQLKSGKERSRWRTKIGHGNDVDRASRQY